MQRRRASLVPSSAAGLAAMALLAVVAAPHVADAKVQTKDVTYKVGEQTFKGLLAWDDAKEGKRPGVLVVHEWWGLNDYAKMRAQKLAELGYAALALDMFGDGKNTTHPEEAGAMSGAVAKDPAAARARFLAAKGVLEADPHVDATKIGAIGYCFGGTTVLEMARHGVPLKGVVSFHGHLAPVTKDPPDVKAKVLVCTGASDPMVPAADIAAFNEEMTAAKADWQLIAYGGAKHSFTNPGADKVGMEALAYNASADRRSWEAMTDFFREAFAK